MTRKRRIHPNFRFQLLVLLSFLWLVSACQSESNSVSLNEQHRIAIDGNGIRYNEGNVELGKSVEEWIAALGVYSRKIEKGSDLYVWDEMGVFLYTLPGDDKVNSMVVIFQDYKHQAVQTEQVFANSILLDGALIHKNAKIENINRAKTGGRFSKGHLSNIYDYDYLSDQQESTYVRLDLLKDKSIRKFSIGIQPVR